MSYIKRKRDQREHEAKRATEVHVAWQRHTRELNKKAIEEEIRISNEGIWTVPEPATFTPIWGNQ